MTQPAPPPAKFWLAHPSRHSRNDSAQYITELVWRPRVTLGVYLHEANLVGVRQRCTLRKTNGERVRSMYEPQPNETITLVPARNT